jgi:hypothetical protein
MDAVNNIDVYKDIDKRHEKSHEGDPQIDYMYMRQAKKRKSKAKLLKSDKFIELPIDKAIIMEEIRISIDKASPIIKKIKKQCSCKKK